MFLLAWIIMGNGAKNFHRIGEVASKKGYFGGTSLTWTLKGQGPGGDRFPW